MVKKDEVMAKIKEIASEGKITCTDALQVAKDFEVDPSEVGKLCNESEIKIHACELGCF